MRIRRRPSSSLSSNNFLEPLVPDPTSEQVIPPNCCTDGTKNTNGISGVIQHQAAAEEGLHPAGCLPAESDQLCAPKSSVSHFLNQVLKNDDEMKQEEDLKIEIVDGGQHQINSNKRYNGNTATTVSDAALPHKQTNGLLGVMPITKGKTTTKKARSSEGITISLSNNCTVVNGSSNESRNNTSESVVTQELLISETEPHITSKKRRRPAVLVEGSRCSRVNGRGWRCCQQTLVGYSLCEHHLGKGRLRSMNSLRGQIGTSKPQQSNIDESLNSILQSTLSLPASLSANDEEHVSVDGVVLERMTDEVLDKIVGKKKKKIGIVKARNINTLKESSSSLAGGLQHQPAGSCTK